MVSESAVRPAISLDTDISPSFTLGIEEEYMVIDPLTFNLNLMWMLVCSKKSIASS
jgi:hypothetical protein